MKNKCYDFSKLSGKPVSYVNKEDFMNLGTFLINSNFKNTPCYTLDEGNPEHFFARLGSQVRRLGKQEFCQVRNLGTFPGLEVRKFSKFRKFARLGSLPGQKLLGQELRTFARLGSQEACQVGKFSKFRKFARLGVRKFARLRNYEVRKLGQEVSTNIWNFSDWIDFKVSQRLDQ